MKTFWCKFDCKILLTYDYGIIGKNGNGIPTLVDGMFHDCPNDPHRFSRRRMFESIIIDMARQIIAKYDARLRDYRLILLIEKPQEAQAT